jgi:hypothetical protein
MARLAGFEPTTPWFVAKYSIQLSYSRAAAQYSSADSDVGGRHATVSRQAAIATVRLAV